MVSGFSTHFTQMVSVEFMDKGILRDLCSARVTSFSYNPCVRLALVCWDAYRLSAPPTAIRTCHHFHKIKVLLSRLNLVDQSAGVPSPCTTAIFTV